MLWNLSVLVSSLTHSKRTTTTFFGLIVVPVEGGEDTFRGIGFFGSDYWCRSGNEAAEDIVRQFPKKEVVLG